MHPYCDGISATFNNLFSAAYTVDSKAYDLFHTLFINYQVVLVLIRADTACLTY